MRSGKDNARCSARPLIATCAPFDMREPCTQRKLCLSRRGGGCGFFCFFGAQSARLALNFVRFVHNQTLLCTSARMAREEEEFSDEFRISVVRG